MLLVANPMAGLRRRSGLLEDLRASLREQQVRAELHLTVAPGDASRAAADAASSGGFDAILAVGGDGTAHEVVNGLAGTSIPFCVVPTGTMNILARELGLPLDPVGSIRRLRSFRPFPFTTGLMGGRHFLLMAGIGLDAYALALALRRAGSRKLTLARYVMAAISAAHRFPYARIDVLADGELHSGTSAIIGNLPRYGANLRITPKADPLDPFLDLCLIRGEGMRAYAGVFRSMLLGGRHMGRRDVVYRKVSRIEIRASGTTPLAHGAPQMPDLTVQMDGELIGSPPRGSLVIEARPDAVQVLAPSGWRR